MPHPRPPTSPWRGYGLRLLGGDTTATSGPLAVSVFALGRATWEPLPRASVRPGWFIGLTGPLGGEALALAERRPTRPQPRFRDLAPGCVCGDVSDGLLRELAKFQAIAGVGARIESAKVPIAPGASLEQALTGGEEVELICAWPGEPRPELTVIGAFTAGGRILVDGEEREGGYDHFG